MVDVDIFLTILYVMVDDFCQTQPSKKRPGPEASLNRLVRLYTQSIEEIAVNLGKMLEDKAHAYPRHSIVLRCPSGMRGDVDTAG